MFNIHVLKLPPNYNILLQIPKCLKQHFVTFYPNLVFGEIVAMVWYIDYCLIVFYKLSPIKVKLVLGCSPLWLYPKTENKKLIAILSKLLNWSLLFLASHKSLQAMFVFHYSFVAKVVIKVVKKTMVHWSLVFLSQPWWK